MLMILRHIRVWSSLLRVCNLYLFPTVKTTNSKLISFYEISNLARENKYPFHEYFGSSKLMRTYIFVLLATSITEHI
jgi:hypothetical protein